MEFFLRLGRVVNNRWKDVNYREEEFSRVAAGALAEFPPDQHVTLWDITNWGLTAEQMPPQADLAASFGQPPLTVYDGPGFRIEVLFWIQGLPAIHQHSFSGAFHVLHGSSLHSLWKFESSKRISMRLALGRLSLEKAELLYKGDTRVIIAGSEMIHSTFHLDRPSLTVVVRTTQEVDKMPQYSYLPPTIAYDPELIGYVTKRRLQLLRMLLISKRRVEFNEIAHYIVGTEDAYSVFQYLLSIFELIESQDERDALLLAAKLKHGELIEALEPALQYVERRNKILAIRDLVSSTQLQFFLALLLNLPKLSPILDLIKQRHPSEDPIGMAMNWIRELSRSGVLGVRFPETWFLMLESLLLGRSSRETRRVFTEKYQTQIAPNLDAALEELSSGLTQSWLLQPMFAKGTANNSCSIINKA